MSKAEVSTPVVNKHYAYINPVQFGYDACEPSHAFGPAIRTHWLLHFIAEGSGTFCNARGTHTLRAGDIFVIAPYEETYYEADATTPWSYIWIGFTCSNELPTSLPDVLHCPTAARLFEDMKRCAEREGGRTEYLCAKIWELFSLLTEEKHAVTDYVKAALALLHTEYVNGITVSRVAELLHINRSYLSVLFKKRMGVSVAEYLTDYKMKRAAELMTKKHMSITVTALSVGYPDVYTFSKAFKKHFGMSPRAYKKQPPCQAESP